MLKYDVLCYNTLKDAKRYYKITPSSGAAEQAGQGLGLGSPSQGILRVLPQVEKSDSAGPPIVFRSASTV